MDVILLERDRLGGVDTECTTAHLTMVTDEPLSGRRVRKTGIQIAGSIQW